MKCLCFHYISLLLATFIFSQIPAWGGKKSAENKTRHPIQIAISGTNRTITILPPETLDAKKEVYTLGEVKNDDGSTLADSVLKILDASRILSDPENISKLIRSRSWQHKKYNPITADDHKKILENEIQLNDFYLLSYSDKAGETIAKSLTKQVHELAKEFDKLDDIDPPLTQESQDVLNIILKPTEYPFSKKTIGSFYEELENNKGIELIAPEWFDSHDSETLLSLVFLKNLWNKIKTPKIQKPNKLQKSQKRSRKVSESASPNKQTSWQGYRIPMKKAKSDYTNGNKTEQTKSTENSGFAGKNNPFHFDETDK